MNELALQLIAKEKEEKTKKVHIVGYKYNWFTEGVMNFWTKL